MITKPEAGDRVELCQGLAWPDLLTTDSGERWNVKACRNGTVVAIKRGQAGRLHIVVEADPPNMARHTFRNYQLTRLSAPPAPPPMRANLFRWRGSQGETDTAKLVRFLRSQDIRVEALDGLDTVLLHHEAYHRSAGKRWSESPEYVFAHDNGGEIDLYAPNVPTDRFFFSVLTSPGYCASSACRAFCMTSASLM